MTIHFQFPVPSSVSSSSSPDPSSPAPLSPLPDNKAMLSPQLRAELNKFGLKAAPGRKACRLLNEIYERTHPLVVSADQKPALIQDQGW